MDSFDMPPISADMLKFRIVRTNPLILDPGQIFLLGGRQTDDKGNFTMFPARLEWSIGGGVWNEVGFENEMVSFKAGNV